MSASKAKLNSAGARGVRADAYSDNRSREVRIANPTGSGVNALRWAKYLVRPVVVQDDGAEPLIRSGERVETWNEFAQGDGSLRQHVVLNLHVILPPLIGVGDGLDLTQHVRCPVRAEREIVGVKLADDRISHLTADGRLVGRPVEVKGEAVHGLLGEANPAVNLADIAALSEDTTTFPASLLIGVAFDAMEVAILVGR